MLFIQSVGTGYTRCNDDKKFQISALLIQLESLMSMSGGDSLIMQSSDGFSTLDVPTKECIHTQTKNRQKPEHEVRSDKATKKMKLCVQRAGLS